jgi:hypothetical protein
MLLVANELLAISFVPLIQTDRVTIDKIAHSDTFHDRMELVDVSYWNEGRCNINVYAE